MPTIATRPGRRGEAPLTLRGTWGRLTVPDSERWTASDRERYYRGVLATAGVPPDPTPAIALGRVSHVPELGGWIPDEPIGDRLARIQRMLGLAGKEIAARLHTTPAQWSNWRGGRRETLPITTLERIAAALELPLTVFAGCSPAAKTAA